MSRRQKSGKRTSARVRVLPIREQLQKLAEVHTGRHAERVQDDVNRPTVRQERHVFNRNDRRNDTLVSVPAGHFIADRKLALLCNIDFRKLHDAWSELVTELNLVLLVTIELFDLAQLLPEVFINFHYEVALALVVHPFLIVIKGVEVLQRLE